MHISCINPFFKRMVKFPKIFVNGEVLKKIQKGGVRTKWEWVP